MTIVDPWPWNRACVLSPCEKYRYRLEEELPSGVGSLCWIMINPSTANATKDDATIRKVRGFTARHGFGKWIVVNLFAYRTDDIVEARRAHACGHGIGPENDRYILEAVANADDVVCAWGPKPWAYPRAHGVIQLLRTWHPSKMPRLHALGFAKDGAPFHPLMQPYARPFVPYGEAR